MKNKKFAFTLAEVLITLGIIGVVAALTMPMLIGHYKKEEAISRLKKAYTIANQAYKRSEVDNGEYQNWESAFDIGAENYINKYWLPYFNTAKLCKKYYDCGYTTNTPFYYLNGTKHGLEVANPNLRFPFFTADGIMYSISATSGDATAPDTSIYVDINAGKGPNVYGRDVFIFYRDSSGKGVLPSCSTNSEANVNSNCSASGSGTCCAQKIIQEGWKINYKF